jgi:hypothetical protein
MISPHSVVGICFPMILSSSEYTHDCIPCNGANINAFQHYHFVPKGIIVDLPMNVKQAVALEVFSTFLEKLQSQRLNLHTREGLNTILPTTSNA